MNGLKKTHLYLNRQDFITLNVIGTVLDVGTNDGSGWSASHGRLGLEFEEDNNWLTHFDCDLWIHPNMVRGDAHFLPFNDNSFDTVVFGDVMEHVVNPYTVLNEAARVASKRIIITVPDEYEWHESLKPFKDIDEHLTEIGKTLDEEAYENTVGFTTAKVKCMDFVLESEMPHLNHARQFNFQLLSRLIRKCIDSKCEVRMNHLYHDLGENIAKHMAYNSIIIDYPKRRTTV